MASSDCRELYGMGEIEVILWRKFISIELKGTIQPEEELKMGYITLYSYWSSHLPWNSLELLLSIGVHLPAKLKGHQQESQRAFIVKKICAA
jgi:hypothetical protein